MNAAEPPAEEERMVPGALEDLSIFVHIALAGLLGAGTIVTYFTIDVWTLSWRSSPRFAGFQWENWMLLSTLGVGLVSIVSGVILSLGWFARAGRRLEAAFWGAVSFVVLSLTAVAIIAAILA